MTLLHTRLASLFLALCCSGVNGQERASKWDVSIPEPINNGALPEPAPKPEPIEFAVKNSRTQLMEVSKTAEMPDLPPIEGTIKVTVQLVKDPGLVDPPPLPPLPPDDPAVIARMAELRMNWHGTKHAFLSATAYDHTHTLLRIYPNGKVDGQVTAWSNIDFNHFIGFSSFRVNASDGTFQDYSLLMGIGNTDTAKTREMLARHGRRYNGPEVPELPDLTTAGPAFVVIAGEANSEAMNTLEQIHDLYRKEGARMAEAYAAREKARAERKAYLLANPTKPKDVTIQFWDRETPSPAGAQILEGMVKP